jgi:hypothetical protein
MSSADRCNVPVKVLKAEMTGVLLEDLVDRPIQLVPDLIRLHTVHDLVLLERLRGQIRQRVNKYLWEPGESENCRLSRQYIVTSALP